MATKRKIAKQKIKKPLTPEQRLLVSNFAELHGQYKQYQKDKKAVKIMRRGLNIIAQIDIKPTGCMKGLPDRVFRYRMMIFPNGDSYHYKAKILIKRKD